MAAIRVVEAITTPKPIECVPLCPSRSDDVADPASIIKLKIMFHAGSYMVAALPAARVRALPFGSYPKHNISF
jgi:hypothetical protein